MANYWVFQANPATYFILQYWLEDYAWRQPPGYTDWWGVEKNLGGQFNPGDIAFLWKSAFEPPDCMSEYYKWKARTGWQNRGRGIYAVARITDWGSRKPLDPASLVGQEKYYVDLKRATEHKLLVHFKYPEEPAWDETRGRLLVHPLPWKNDLENHKGLGNLQHNFDPAGRNGQGIKALLLKRDEGEILWKRVFGDALPPPTKK